MMRLVSIKESCQLPVDSCQKFTGNWQLTTGNSSQGDRRDSNPRRPGPQPGALPTELRPPCVRLCNYFYRVECDSQPTDVRSVTAVPVLSGGRAHYERLCL